MVMALVSHYFLMVSVTFAMLISVVDLAYIIVLISRLCWYYILYIIYYILCIMYYILYIICTIYNMSGRVVSDIQTRAEGESLYIRYNTDANVVNDLKNDSSYEFIGEVILKINVV